MDGKIKVFSVDERGVEHEHSEMNYQVIKEEAGELSADRSHRDPAAVGREVTWQYALALFVVMIMVLCGVYLLG